MSGDDDDDDDDDEYITFVIATHSEFENGQQESCKQLFRL